MVLGYTYLSHLRPSSRKDDSIHHNLVAETMPCLLLPQLLFPLPSPPTLLPLHCVYNIPRITDPLLPLLRWPLPFPLPQMATHLSHPPRCLHQLCIYPHPPPPPPQNKQKKRGVEMGEDRTFKSGLHASSAGLGNFYDTLSTSLLQSYV